ncbi:MULTISPECIES: SDR family oxidoreductase [Staphylococcus]|uniref:Diacetyl reductase [(S)-acetoin forming] n=3 Tax=Staphylococcus TaxID=1279 RepID=A0ABD4EFN6_STALU|nr:MULTISPECIES: SDR family oxidoreductase [Staphylococcus]ADC86364.1 short-chain dehydrogenase/reductase family protein [Staphylococcus lugdunensis HKU09-01]AMG64234.1 3-oxoacyl-(ACP) reductase [Staphylococcus lugdunensis]ARB78923.1 3-oxoacyl-(ACP) reductase [Staphylococcus lugdunensis]ARJ08115.1 3-oxoacyl-(ACP) reductase [Staphylococcus lugdunensis]ARJ12895.1 3-oxoacyl-(ACP) reductase [Staphylococcus lugdunensis]
MFKLTNQIALVTGGANGIGKGIAAALAQAGAKVIIGDIDDTRGKETARELNGDFIELDVTQHDQVKDVVDQIVAKYERIDILASNTGVYPQIDIESLTEADWDYIQNINLKGMFFVTQAVLKVMKAQRYGRVIITSSVTGPITGYPGWAHYGASKAGQLGFMRSAALEYAKYGITVNAVQPGNVLTDGLKAQGEAYLEGTRKIIPTHELGEPLDIGYAVTFFASQEAKFITGQSLVIDGGQLLPEEPDGVL